MKLPCWLHHSWGRWQAYENRYSSRTFLAGVIVGESIPKCDLRQRRQCLVCGKQQDVVIVREVGEMGASAEQLARERVESRTR